MAKSKPADTSPQAAEPTPIANPIVTAVLAWLMPGLGHWFIGRRRVAIAYAVLVIGSLVLGWQIGGRLLWQFSGSPIPILGTLGTLGSGLPLLLVRFGFDFTGDPAGAGWEYGGVFIVTAGLMNWLLVLDAWDSALGREPQVVQDPSRGAEDEA